MTARTQRQTIIRTAAIVALLSTLTLTSLQGMALCVGMDGSVSVFAAGTECHCAMHGHEATGCLMAHDAMTKLAAGCNCTDIQFKLSPAVPAAPSRVVAQDTKASHPASGVFRLMSSLFKDDHPNLRMPLSPPGKCPRLLQIETTVLRI